MDIVSKINGNTCSATEFNQIPTELEALQTSSGQTSSDAILNQVSIATSRYAANNFYIDSGTADAYILTLAASMTNPVSATVGYFIGMTIRFRAGNANTGASTVNVNSAGVKNLKQADGTTDLAAGDIPTTRDSTFRYNGTSFVQVIQANLATTSTSGTTLLPSLITIANNATDANNDIDFSAGNFQFSDGTGIASLSALTKRLDATWAAGTNQGGLDTGAVANDTAYYLFAIYNPTSGISDALFSTSSTSPTMPSGYTKKKKIAALMTNGSAQIRNGTWTFNPSGSYQFDYKTQLTQFNDSSTGTSAVLKTITAPANTFAQGIISLFDDSVSGSAPILLITSPSETDTVPTSLINTLDMVAISATGENNFEQTFIIKKLNSSSQLRYRVTVSAADISVKFINYGWIDNNL